MGLQSQHTDSPMHRFRLMEELSLPTTSQVWLPFLKLLPLLLLLMLCLLLLLVLLLPSLLTAQRFYRIWRFSRWAVHSC